jgi:GNAT superfamily N-acetyltransferase
LSVVGDIEQALFAHWSLFGLSPIGELHDEAGLLWYETSIPGLPYNGVIRTRLGDDASADAAIADVVDEFRSRGAQFLWFDHPSATPSDLDRRLAGAGLAAVEQATCMSLELAGWEPGERPEGVTIEEVVDDEGVREYTDLTIRYWEVPEQDRATLAELHRKWGVDGVPGRRFLARIDGEAIGKGYLSLAGPPGVAAIFGMSVRPEARGRGVASGITNVILARARELGCHRVVLHSSAMAVGVYRRAGFEPQCPLTVFATGQLWSDDH